MDCVICSIIKNEQNYLSEWISHHFNLGFKKIFLFEDRGSIPHHNVVGDDPNVILTSLEEEKFDFLFIDNTRKQTTLYNWFINEYYDKYDWVLFIDIDEFVNIESPNTLDTILQNKIDFSSFKIYWRMFNANGNVEKQNNVINTYTRDITEICDENDICPKTFVNLHKPLPMISPHNTLYVSELCDCNTWEVSYKDIWLNHYFTKSWDDWCDRFLKKGDLIPGNRNIWDFFRYNEEMLSDKDTLMKRFWLRKNDINGSVGKGNIKFVHTFSIIPIKEQNTKSDDYFKVLTYNIFVYTISFLFLKKIGAYIKLYTDSESKKYLEHIEYDDIVIVPDNITSNNGLTNALLRYGIEQENSDAYFVHGDCFLQDSVIIDFLKNNTADLTVFQTYVKDNDTFFLDSIYNTTNILTFLSPELDCNGESFNTGILNIQNQAFKEEFLKTYDSVVKTYEKSELKKLWEKTKHFNPDKILFTNALCKVANKFNLRINNISSVLLQHNTEKQINEKLFFLGIVHPGEDLICNDDILQQLRHILESISQEIYDITLKHIMNIIKGDE